MNHIDKVSSSSNESEPTTPEPAQPEVPQSTGKGDVTITVTHEDASPAGNIHVSIVDTRKGFDGTTDSNGVCTIRNIPIGDYFACVDDEGYVFDETANPIKVVEGENSISLIAYPEVEEPEVVVTSDISVTVLDSEDEPINGASVTVSDGTNEYTGNTGKLGGCTVRNVPLGEYVIETVKEGYVTSEDDFTVVDGENIFTVKLDLDEGP